MKRFALAVIMLLLVSSQAGWCAGIALYETGAPDLGTASAGRAAMAADASTVVTNPAGMTLLDRSQFMFTSGAMLRAINFDRGSDTKVPGGGGGGGNAGVFFRSVASSTRTNLPIACGSERLSTPTFGLASDYSLNWVGRYQLTSSSIITGQITPNIAYRINDWLSVGAGFSFSVARFKTQAKINNILPRFGEGGLSIESWDEGFGGNIGFLLRPIAKLKNRTDLQFAGRSPREF